MVHKNETFTAQVTGYTSEGLGVVRKDGQVVFVKDAIAGEVYEVLVETVNSNRRLRQDSEAAETLCPSGSPEMSLCQAVRGLPVLAYGL